MKQLNNLLIIQDNSYKPKEPPTNEEKLKLYRKGVNQPVDYKISPKKYCLALANETKMFLYENFDIFSVSKKSQTHL